MNSTLDTVQSVHTSEVTQEILDGKGYVLLPNLIEPTQAQEARAIILDLLEKERALNKLFIHGKSERVYGLIYKGQIFEYLAQHPVVMAAMESILGSDLLMGGFSAHVLQPGAIPIGLHVDYPYFAMKPPFHTHPALQVQVIWMLEDFTEENGATLFGPGTQKLASLPQQSHFSQIAEQVTGKAGSAVLSHTLAWHDTSMNSTNQPRVAIVANYCLKVVHPIEDLFQDQCQEVLDRASPQLKQLLGHNFWSDLMQDGQRMVEQSQQA
jgi:ectoine hydroxylase-related dioxygenase (phytanoyl-CoA dioxygenase family)